MKKALKAIFIITWLALFVFFVFGLLNKSSQNNEKHTSEHGFTYVDYPLIEYYFDTEDEWKCVIYENVYGSTPKCYENTNKESLELNKDKLVVNTFPQGRGTTETHVVVLMKNGEPEKTIYCHDYVIENEDFAADFLEVED